MPVVVSIRIRKMSRVKLSLDVCHSWEQGTLFNPFGARSDLTHAEDRELIEPNDGDKRYIRRDEEGKFTESQDEVGRSLRQDRRTEAETEVEEGQGDRGDRR